MAHTHKYKIFGHEKILSELINLDKINKLPNKILLSGKNGIGKSTMAYHFINYLFSKNENFKYDISNFIINYNNKSNILVNSNTHPNLFKIYLKDDKKNIEISEIRNLINFTNLSSLGDQKKIILIDDVEYLSINAVNALLKVVEEPNDNTFFILINNSSKKIIHTLRSRCIEFKLSIDKSVIKNIINDLYKEINYDDISPDFIRYSITLSGLIDFLNICINEKLNYNDITIEIFLKYIFENNLYKKKEFQLIDFKSFIEIFFLKKIKYLKDDSVFSIYSHFNVKYHKFKKFNLDMESFFLEFNSKLLNE